jgi:hypothetical protein
MRMFSSPQSYIISCEPLTVALSCQRRDPRLAPGQLQRRAAPLRVIHAQLVLPRPYHHLGAFPI